jgi:exodeoxyribonuclease VII small subunit
MRVGKVMEELTFEEAFSRLEETVLALQDGQMGLESALSRYEEGMRLAQYCNTLLQKAELRVQLLGTDNEGVLSLQPFELAE